VTIRRALRRLSAPSADPSTIRSSSAPTTIDWSGPPPAASCSCLPRGGHRPANSGARRVFPLPGSPVMTTRRRGFAPAAPCAGGPSTRSAGDPADLTTNRDPQHRTRSPGEAGDHRPGYRGWSVYWVTTRPPPGIEGSAASGPADVANPAASYEATRQTPRTRGVRGAVSRMRFRRPRTEWQRQPPTARPRQADPGRPNLLMVGGRGVARPGPAVEAAWRTRDTRPCRSATMTSKRRRRGRRLSTWR
jgi:hypothetical protein